MTIQAAGDYNAAKDLLTGMVVNFVSARR